MKWFKTKKDKRIEELEKEVERYKAAMFFAGNRGGRLEPKLLKFAKRCNARNGMDTETAMAMWQAELTKEIAKYIKPYVSWKIKDCGLFYDDHYYELYGSIYVAKEDPE